MASATNVYVHRIWKVREEICSTNPFWVGVGKEKAFTVIIQADQTNIPSEVNINVPGTTKNRTRLYRGQLLSHLGSYCIPLGFDEG